MTSQRDAVAWRYHHRVAILRLFAQAREAAGTGTATFEGVTVDDVVRAAIAEYGDTFAAVVKMSKVWVQWRRGATLACGHR